MDNKPEFMIGDIVTFRAYKDQNIKAIVKEITISINGNLPIYHLRGVSESLATRTTGRSIVQSVIFEDPEEYPFEW